MKSTLFFITLSFLSGICSCAAQDTARSERFTRADTLRGSLNAERNWFNVLRYDISVTPDFNTKSIRGSNKITYAGAGAKYMQIDLQEPLVIDSIVKNGRSLLFKRDGNLFHVLMDRSSQTGQKKDNIQSLTVYYHGNPVVAANPPWDGGWIFKKDNKGRPWMSVACEGVGASIWYPCKDYLGDEPDSGASLSITVPDSLVAIGNGRLISQKANPDKTVTYQWAVLNPINNYNIIPYIGAYVHWHETHTGLKGNLDMDFWVLDYDLERARKQFRGVDSMLTAFEYWFGPYPFYEDGYKLVQAPHLGMEHQSAVAYGNDFLQGYHGKDLSGSGWGYKWDFIIVHESGHEWFGNNISCRDIADEWIHEGFTDYSETLYIEYYFGKEAADDYVTGLRKSIKNKHTIIGIYGVNSEPKSTDEYYKGGNLIHTVRQVINNDSLFRSILTGLNKTFYHQTVTTAQIENYISKRSGINLGPVFDQYLRTIKLPVLEYKQFGYGIQYRWSNCNANFNMPLKISFKGTRWIKPLTRWQSLSLYPEGDTTMTVDRNFYIQVKRLPMQKTSSLQGNSNHL
jgi:aminopeptidase N